MNLFTVSSFKPIVRAAAMIACVATPAVGSTDQPAATPTPRPRTLAAFASHRTLDRSAVDGTTGHVTITSENLAALAAGRSLTIGSPAVSGQSSAKPTAGVDKKERARWRARYQKQSKVIQKLEQRRAMLELEIDRIEDGGMNARNLARLDRAEAKLRLLDEDILGERRRLAKIVHEARSHGAQPGWFR
ncbi:MAG: hypothetical protein ACC742_05390 [Thermoanaerobaculales bacterium]